MSVPDFSYLGAAAVAPSRVPQPVASGWASSFQFAGQRSPESVVRAWMKSPGHCRNILNPLFTELGVSFVFESRSPYKTYWVQAFGTPL